MYLDLKTVRKQKKMTQQELADKSGVSRNYISDLEHLKHEPGITMLLQLCIALKMSPNELLKWEEIKNDDIETFRKRIYNI